MAKRTEPKRKTPADQLADLRAGHQDAEGHGPAEAKKYLEKVLASQHSLPNAVKFFAYDMLVEAAYQAGDATRALEAVTATKQYLEAAQEDAAREVKDYMPTAKYLERGISLLADEGNVEQAMALCDEAIALGLGRAYEAKRQSLERRL